MKRNLNTVIGIIVSVAVSLGIVVTAALAQSGSLEPPSTAVDGSGNPVPTTQTQPSWDQVLPADERFVLVMGGEAVLDKETGLVWEQTPLATAHTWVSARSQCTDRIVGGRKGWRLPSVHELDSLVSRNNSFGIPDLPAGHPFSNVLVSFYWSATSDADIPTKAWGVSFAGPTTGTAPVGKTNTARVWCVRGGGPLSEY